MLNGIADLAARPDLADRALSIVLPPLAEGQRREEREFWAAFEAALPGLLGALLDSVARGLRELPTTRLDGLPRMADFAVWGAACAPGFGWQPGDFLTDYEENRSDAVAAAAEASPLVPAIEAVLARTELDAGGFDGTAAELLDRLGEVCGEAERRARWYPTTPAQAGSALRRIAPLLRARGIEFCPYKDTDRKRTRRIVLRCTSEAGFDELRARLMGRRRPATRRTEPMRKPTSFGDMPAPRGEAGGRTIATCVLRVGNLQEPCFLTGRTWVFGRGSDRLSSLIGVAARAASAAGWVRLMRSGR